MIKTQLLTFEKSSVFVQMVVRLFGQAHEDLINMVVKVSRALVNEVQVRLLHLSLSGLQHAFLFKIPSMNHSRTFGSNYLTTKLFHKLSKVS